MTRYQLDLYDISIISFITIFSLLSRYDVFLFVITIIATDIVKGIGTYVGKVQEQKEYTSSAFGFTHIIT